ncbi:hypothetical protein MASR1M48_16510 [Lactococcus petauri]
MNQIAIIKDILSRPNRKSDPWHNLRNKDGRVELPKRKRTSHKAKKQFKEVEKLKEVKKWHPKCDKDRWYVLRNCVYRIYEKRCMKCKTTSRPMHMDHIFPVARYPELRYSLRNLQILCCDCNIEKLHLNTNDYRTFDDKRRLEGFISKFKNDEKYKEFIFGEKVWVPEKRAT